jgi:hypothetical protein
MKNRKELPAFAKLNKKINLEALREYCVANRYTDYEQFNDIKYSANSKHQAFLVANGGCKESFFKEDNAEFLEGEKYKQLYLTEIDDAKVTTDEQTLTDTTSSIFARTKRLDPSSLRYIPEADELNYTVRNAHVKGIFEEILNSFDSQVTRVRLAVLMPEFAIKPHVDYDPSYITRYHIPIFTNDEVVFGVKKGKDKIEFTMPADGSVYFLNSGLLHWVSNNSNQPRLHLIVDTHGQDDLDLSDS